MIEKSNNLDKSNKCNILLVDDLEENLLSLEALLKSETISLVKANSGQEALEILLKGDRSFALALVDVQMPEMSGFELAEFMRGTEKTKAIPIIFVTAGTADQQRKFRGYEAGAVDFIQKPIEADILKSKVNIFCSLFMQKRELARQRDELQKSQEEARLLLKESQELTQVLQTANQNKNEFLATLAHELRNPLAPIQNALEILSGDLALDQSSKLVAMMRRQVSHLINLVDDLMDMSRVSQGCIELKIKEITLAQAVELALDLSTPIMQQKGHDFSYHLPAEDIWLNADLSRMAQILGNLLHNAGKYTPDKGKIRLDIEIEEDTVHIIIKDNGVGIPAEQQTEVYNIFKRLNHHAQSHQDGLGIGLSLVKKLVTMHDGDITLESEGENKGASFKVSLPIIAAPQAKGNNIANRIKNVGRTSSKKHNNLKVLIVDDNEEAALTLGMMIETMEHKYIVAHRGKEAVELALQETPDIILLDIGLPDISGYEVAQTLTQEESLDRTLLVAQTGWGQEEDKKKSKSAGFDRHLVKPVTMDDLKNILELYHEYA